MTISEYHEITEKLRPKFHGFLFNYLRNNADVEDVLQEAYIKLWEHMDSVTIHTAKSWLYTTGKNASINILKTRGRLNYSDENDYDFNGSVASKQPDVEVTNIIKDSVDKLPSLQRRLIILRDVHGFTYKEISDRLKLTETQVKVYLFRARKSLKDKLKQFYVERN